MFSEKKPLRVHIELSDKCNAMCPQCGRNRIVGDKINPKNTDMQDINYVGGGQLQVKPNIQTGELVLEDYKKVFDDKFYDTFNLQKINYCGNRSDPIASKDLHEIVEYSHSRDSKTAIVIATNGGLKTTEWWSKFGKLMSGIRHNVVFGLDGLEDTHHIYRQRTNFKKVISNAKTFIQNGGIAEWQMLVFKHNQHQIDDAKQMAKEIGFLNFKEVYTPRFWSKEDGEKLEFKVGDKHYKLEPSTLDKNPIDNKKLAKHFSKKNKNRDKESGHIECKALNINEFFLDFNGNVLPCCWLGNSLNRRSEPWLKDTLRYADNIMNWYDPKVMNAIDNDLTDILLKSIWMKQLQKTWDIAPCKTCARFCSKRINIKKAINREAL